MNQINEVKNSQKNYQELQKYEQAFKETNTRSAEILQVDGAHLQWSKVIDAINKVVPDGVYLTDLGTSDLKISLTGKARTREEFLVFQRALQGEACFINVNTPLSNILSKEKVDFQVDFEVTDQCIKTQ